MPYLYLTRDSVAAGDDVSAPHRKRISTKANALLPEVLTEIMRLGYLAGIAGGKATWVVEASGPLAVIAQQWLKPVILPEGIALTSLPNELHFRYLAQEDPDQVVTRFCVNSTRADSSSS